MKRSQKYMSFFMLEPYLILALLVLFVAQFITMQDDDSSTYVWFGCTVLLLVISYTKNRVLGLLLSLGVIFTFGTLHLVRFFVFMENARFTLLELSWFVLFPLAAYTGGVLGEKVRSMYEEYRHMYRSVDELMMVDPITGLATEKRFFFDLEEEIQREYRHFIRRQRAGLVVGTWKEQAPETTPQDEQVTIMLIEIVHYDQFQILYGQEWGRRLLLAFTEGLHSSLRLSDKKARVGDARFALILPETHPSNAMVVQNRLRETIDTFQMQVNANQMKEVTFTLKFGLASTPHQGESPQELYDVAKRELLYDLG